MTDNDKEQAAQLAAVIISDMFGAIDGEQLTWQQCVFAGALAIKGMATWAAKGSDVNAPGHPVKLETLDLITDAMLAHVMARPVDTPEEVGTVVHKRGGRGALN